jgi:5-methylcytosine-specific restriction protein A
VPGWQGSTRKERLPPDWAQIRKRILARDNYRCTWVERGEQCPATATDVDHRKPGDDHTESNLRSLCHPHHQRKSSGEGGRAYRRVTKYNVKRPAEQHPGLRKQPE